MSDWIEDFEEELYDGKPVVTRPQPKPESIIVKEQPKVIMPKTPVITKPIAPKKKEDNGWLILLVYLMFLIIAVAVVFKLRGDAMSQLHYPVQEQIQQPVDERPIFEPQPTVNLGAVYSRLDVIERQQDKMIELNDKVWERVQRNSSRISINGTLDNHNNMVDRRGMSRTNYIYINRDWTIDRLPNTLTLTDEDREFLEGHLKK